MDAHFREVEEKGCPLQGSGGQKKSSWLRSKSRRGDEQELKQKKYCREEDATEEKKPAEMEEEESQP
ncbi:hypothetical protein GCK32_012709 [Trichostrongylus colubriformis]|uniref:Uncharacterized protein n=1 Tax=Trichostrongylus colubriformis TaxID=6319 RepID=A0AAN8FC23_TRICO